ncbi:hypothetical protein D3C81_1902530 [compost metagenome]
MAELEQQPIAPPAQAAVHGVDLFAGVMKTVQFVMVRIRVLGKIRFRPYPGQPGDTAGVTRVPVKPLGTFEVVLGVGFEHPAVQVVT